MQNAYVIGMDLGGTKISTALCDLSGNIIYDEKISTLASQGADAVINRLLDSIRSVIKHSNIPPDHIKGIGISSPGPLSTSEGKVVFAPMLNWRNVYLRDIVSEAFGMPVLLEKDTNAAAYGEKFLGAGKGYNNIIYITVSTGIGSGIICNGEIVHGKHDFAGEFGHICIYPGGRLCACGKNGCLEAYASGPSIVALAQESDLSGSSILTLSDNDISKIDCPIIAEAARSGDEFATTLWQQMGTHLGHGVSILLQLFDPDIVIFGGGVTHAWPLFYDAMAQTVKENTFQMISDDIILSQSGLGQNSCVLGAAMLAAHQ